jgi:hypothetical protein
MADLIGDDISRAFSAHPGLPACVVGLHRALLKDRHQQILKQGHIATANRLAGLAARDEVAGAVYELNRRRHTLTHDPLFGDYLRPTIDALFWRDTRLRSEVRANPQLACLLPAFRCAARDESSWRACIFIEILSELAKMTTQPHERAVAKVAGPARAAVKEWQTAEALRAFGLPDDAARHTQRALFHLWCAQNLAREWTPNLDELLLVTSWRLAWHFGFRGDRIAAALVSAALELDVPISHWHTRYVVKSLSK